LKAFILTKSSDERQTLLAKAGTVGGDTTQPTSWEHVNNAVIERLYRAHGNDLEFVGVILHRTRFEFFEEKQLSAKQAATLAG